MAVGDAVDGAVEQLINTASALGSTTIDLSKKRLTQVPPDVLNLQQLEVNLMAIFIIFIYHLWTARLPLIAVIVFDNFHKWLSKKKKEAYSSLQIHFALLCHFQFLYLEGNSISSLPEELFDCLPNLRWLDLRNNRIAEIPSVIGKHRFVMNRPSQLEISMSL